MNPNRRPGTLAEARTLVAYNERILATSQSQQRRDRAAAMLANLQPELADLEARATRVPDLPPALPLPPESDEFEVVWNGGPLVNWPHADEDDWKVTSEQ